MKKKALLSSMLVIALCLCLVAGSTYALFTSQSVMNVAVTAGKVEVVAGIDEGLLTWSLRQTEDQAGNGTFANGGVAEITDGVLTIDRMTPGDTVKFTIHVTNTSNVATKYRLNAVSQASDSPTDLSEALVIESVVDDHKDDTENQTHTMSYTDAENDARSFSTAWFSASATDGTNGVEILTVTVTVTFPNGTAEHDNQFQNAKAKLAFTVEAVQGNGVDTSSGNLITP